VVHTLTDRQTDKSDRKHCHGEGIKLIITCFSNVGLKQLIDMLSKDVLILPHKRTKVGLCDRLGFYF